MFGTQPKKTSKDVISKALGAFTDVKNQLDEGITLGEEEASTKLAEMDILAADLSSIQKATADATIVRDNISKLLGN